MTRARLFLLAFALPACAHLSVPDDSLADLRDGAIDPCRVTLTCHGIFKDFGVPWDYRLRDELAEQGRLALVTTYMAEPTGVWFGYGASAPGRVIADIADDITRLHDDSGCPVPLELTAVGFSNGCEVLMEAARIARIARFDDVVFSASSAFAFSDEPRELIDDGRIGAIHDHWSPVDLVTLLAPLGAGSFGTRAGSDRIEHHAHVRYHLPPLLRSDRDHLAAPLLTSRDDHVAMDDSRDVQSRFARALAALLERRRTRQD